MQKPCKWVRPSSCGHALEAWSGRPSQGTGACCHFHPEPELPPKWLTVLEKNRHPSLSPEFWKRRYDTVRKYTCCHLCVPCPPQSCAVYLLGHFSSPEHYDFYRIDNIFTVVNPWESECLWTSNGRHCCRDSGKAERFRLGSDAESYAIH